MANDYPFDAAVADFVAGLAEDRRRVLREVTLNPQAENDWPWFEEVIQRFRLREKDSPVRRDINERVDPDPYGLNALLWSGVGNEEPVFEAMTLLKEVRKALLTTGSGTAG